MHFPDPEHAPATIAFHLNDQAVSLPDQHLLHTWLTAIAEAEGKSIQSLEYIFCNDEALLQINRQYLGHDTLTDIITFPFAQNPIEAEIYISAERVRENASFYDEPAANEFCRVIVHGLLHMCGFRDTSEEEKAVMREKEDYYLGILNKSIV